MIALRAEANPRPRVGVKPPPGGAVGGWPGRWPGPVDCLIDACGLLVCEGDVGAARTRAARFRTIEHVSPVGKTCLTPPCAAHRRNTDVIPTLHRRPETAGLTP
jgi:hypothetical protein